MTLVLTFAALTVGLAALFWGGSLFLQGYMYSQPANQLPLRAAVAGLALGCFLTGWVYLNTRSEPRDKFGTFFDFSPTEAKEFAEFEAVRRTALKGPDGKPKEETAKFRRLPDAKAVEYVDVADAAKRFKLNSSAYVTTALVLPDGAGKTARYEAEFDDKGQYKGRRFTEVGGSRFIDFDEGKPGQVFTPNTGVVVLVLALNAFHFVLWGLLFWAVLRFDPGTAVGLAVVFGGATMLVALPLLFDANRPKPAAVAR